MLENTAAHQVAVTFVGRPPTRQIKRAAGVSGVVAGAHAVRCVVHGSFQPFLEALRGHEVVCLSSLSALGCAQLDGQGASG